MKEEWHVLSNHKELPSSDRVAPPNKAPTAHAQVAISPTHMKICNKKMDFLHAVKKLKKPSLSEFSQSDFEDWGLINVELRSHQLEGARWLAERYEREHGCILGDEMGLGKTLQVLNVIVLSYDSYNI